MRRGLALSLVLSVVFLVGSPAVAQRRRWRRRPSSRASILTGEPCTGVPDAVPGVFDFTAACTQHDLCYATSVDRLACDQAFRQAMVSACQAQFPDLFGPGATRA